MTTYRLTYFDFDGGRAEPVRIALHAAGIDFEDHRISFEEFNQIREGLRFKAVPVLEIDGAQVTQTNAMLRYAGRLANLYPADDPLQALYCDEILDTVEDATNALVKTFGLKDDELRAAREEFLNGPMRLILDGLEALLLRGGGRYFAADRLTIADLKANELSRSLRSGILDHVPTGYVDDVAPTLTEHHVRIAADPIVVGWYATRHDV